MYRKLILIFAAMTALALFAACAAPAPAAQEEAASQPAADSVAEEATEEAMEETVAEDASASADGEAGVYVVDPAASSVEWYGSKPVGASESGTVDIAEGQLNFDGSSFASGTIVIDMTTIAPTSQTGNMLDMLTGHLNSDEFFGVETYPTATLVIKSAEPTDVENQYAVVADLTIKETTDEIAFVTDVAVDGEMLDATADIVVDRSIYDVRYGSGAFFSDLGDDLISDEMEMTVRLVAASE